MFRKAAQIVLALAIGIALSQMLEIGISAVVAQTGAPPLKPTDTVLTLLASYAIEILQIAMPVLIAWLSLRLNTWFGLRREAELRESLQTALENAAGKMIGKVGSAANVLLTASALRNQALAEGLNYMQEAAPDAIRHFGLNRDSLIEKLEAKVGLKVAEAPKGR